MSIVVELTFRERSAIATLGMLADNDTRKELEREGLPINIWEYHPNQQMWERLINLGLVTKGDMIKYGIGEEMVELPNLYLSTFGKKFVKQYGLSSREFYVPNKLSNYRFVPTFLLERVVSAIMSFLASNPGNKQNLTLLDKITDKISNLTPSQWRNEWEILDK